MPTLALAFPTILAAALAGVIASRAVIAVPAGERLGSVPWRVHVQAAGARRVVLVAGAVTMGAGVAVASLPAVYWPAAIWLTFLAITLSAIDLRHHRLPDKLTLPGLPVLMISLLIPALSEGAWGQWGRALAGAGVLAAVYWVGWFLGGLGYGDVKLAPTIGAITAWCGWPTFITGAVAVCFIAAIAGILFALPEAAAAGRGNRWASFRKARMPFGPAMFVGALVAIVWGEQVVTWYLAGAQ